jgi:hypothetical protein
VEGGKTEKTRRPEGGLINQKGIKERQREQKMKQRSRGMREKKSKTAKNSGGVFNITETENLSRAVGPSRSQLCAPHRSQLCAPQLYCRLSPFHLHRLIASLCSAPCSVVCSADSVLPAESRLPLRPFGPNFRRFWVKAPQLISGNGVSSIL